MTTFADHGVPTLGYDADGFPLYARRGRRRDERAATSAELLHARTYAEPLSRLIRRTLPEEYAETLRPCLADVATDYASPGGTGVTVWLPRDVLVTPQLRRTLSDCVRQSLGLGELDGEWSESGPAPAVVFRVRAQPPGRVMWADVERHAAAARDTAPVIGLDRRGRPVDVDLESDSPHVLISAGSGGGKSELVKLILAAGLARGAGVVILDFKRSSHRWAKDVPGVLYCRDVAEIHHALIALGVEAERRNVAADDPAADLGPRIFVCAEEMNATMSRIQTYWDEIRDKSDPKISPAVRAFRDILFMGRSAKVNVVAIAQLGTARTIGGPEARENFATRCLTRYTVNAWKMLAPEVWPAPKRSKTIGRWQIVKHGEATETQVALMTDDQAREWATRSPLAIDPVSQLRQLPAITVTSGNAEELPRPVLVTLRDALSQVPELATSLDALRRAAQRDGFPSPAGSSGTAKLYDIGQLGRWRREREACRAASRPTPAIGQQQ